MEISKKEMRERMDNSGSKSASESLQHRGDPDVVDHLKCQWQELISDGLKITEVEKKASVPNANRSRPRDGWKQFFRQRVVALLPPLKKIFDAIRHHAARYTADRKVNATSGLPADKTDGNVSKTADISTSSEHQKGEGEHMRSLSDVGLVSGSAADAGRLSREPLMDYLWQLSEDGLSSRVSFVSAFRNSNTEGVARSGR